jgi:hypothetical protein
MNLFFFSLLSFTRNCIKVRFLFFYFFFFFCVFFHYICFPILFLKFSVLNNYLNVVVGFFFHMRLIFSWFIYRIFNFLVIATSFFSYMKLFLVDLFIYLLLLLFFYVIYLLQICLSWFSSSFFLSNLVLSIMECWFILI